MSWVALIILSAVAWAVSGVFLQSKSVHQSVFQFQSFQIKNVHFLFLFYMLNFTSKAPLLSSIRFFSIMVFSNVLCMSSPRLWRLTCWSMRAWEHQVNSTEEYPPKNISSLIRGIPLTELWFQNVQPAACFTPCFRTLSHFRHQKMSARNGILQKMFRSRKKSYKSLKRGYSWVELPY